MREGLISLAVLLCGCGGVAGNIPADFATYGFQASVEVATQTPQPGQRVDFIVGLTSTGNVPVLGDVTLDVVGENDEGNLYTQKWDSVDFMPDDPWNLENGFLAATDVKKTYNLSVEVRRHDTGELLYQNAAVNHLVFPNQ